MFRQKRKDKRILEQEHHQRQEFKKTLSLARAILDSPTDYKYGDTHPIYLLIKSLVNQEFYKNVYRSVSTHDDNKVHSFGIQDILPRPESKNKSFLVSLDEEKYLYRNTLSNVSYSNVSYLEMLEKSRVSGQCISDKIRATGKDIIITLGNDPVLTRPWNIVRLHDSMKNIGENKKSGDWTQDVNHRVELWLPFGVTFVNSGNHSITTGILNNEGQLNLDLDYLYNMKYEALHSIQCDGVNYFRVEDNSYLAPVTNISMAAVFEIGKLIRGAGYQQKIRFKGIDVN